MAFAMNMEGHKGFQARKRGESHELILVQLAPDYPFSLVVLLLCSHKNVCDANH